MPSDNAGSRRADSGSLAQRPPSQGAAERAISALPTDDGFCETFHASERFGAQCWTWFLAVDHISTIMVFLFGIHRQIAKSVYLYDFRPTLPLNRRCLSTILVFSERNGAFGYYREIRSYYLLESGPCLFILSPVIGTGMVMKP